MSSSARVVIPPAADAGPERLAQAARAIEAQLQAAGLRRSSRRSAVVEAFLASRGHVSVEEVAARVRAAGIGQTTVYRTLRLLAERGLATARRFGDGQTRFEPSARGEHHDHLVCHACGAIEEFEDAALEREQQAIARRHGFQLQGHTFELHGRCRHCRGERRSRRQQP